MPFDDSTSKSSTIVKDSTSHDGCRTSFVSDLPAASDAFGPNRAYQRIIDAIVHIIHRDQPSEGMAIGLEGSWGAGKTTIISLLRNRIGEKTDSSKDTLRTVIATFDAWAHEGDPLRLAFIDSLTTKLIDAAWVDSAKWRERLEIVSRRRQVQDTFRDFRPTPLDFLNALLFFLIPIGVPLLNSALRTGITISIHQPLAWDLWLGLVCFLAAPVLGLARLISRRRQSQNPARRTTLADEPDKKQSLFSLLLMRTLSNERTVVIKTPEPTSFEFEKHFSELMEDALCETDRKLVLVVDNLDRVHPEEAHRIWSTLQTFLQYRHYNPPPWLSRLFTIILYDPTRISAQTTAPMIGTTIGGDEYSSQILAPIDDEESIQSSFLDKTIQVRFEVPAPILSDWHGYLLSLLGNALPDHDQTEHHQVYRILAVHMIRQTRLPTIRELKIYVNQICATHLQWQDAFPLTHIAYYVLLRRRGESISEGLLQGRYPERSYKGLVGEEVRKTIAALLFNVDPQIAYQLLLAPPIEGALATRDSQALEQLAQNFANGFWEVLENTISFEWAGEDGERVANAIFTIDESRILEVNRDESHSIRRTLGDIASSLKAWKPFNETIANSISSVLHWAESSGQSREQRRFMVEKVMVSVAQGLFDMNPSIKTLVDVPAWLKGLNTVIDANRVSTPKIRTIEKKRFPGRIGNPGGQDEAEQIQ